MSKAITKETLIKCDKEFYSNRIDDLAKYNVNKFLYILRSYTLFNVLFILLMIGEISYFLIHLSLLAQTFTLAIHVALIFATIFSYITLRIYVHSHKLERLMQLKCEFIKACQEIVPELSKGEPEHHLMITHACCKLAADLHGKEYVIYTCPKWLLFLSSSVEKTNCCLFWKDVHFMKEFLLQACINEHVKLVKLEPTSLEAHAGLANVYVMLSALYIDPRTVEGMDEERWIPQNKYNDSFKHKFRIVAERAIEEFKILSDYAPNDPWVHAQLAFSYRDLHMIKEEILEYEIILQLCPNDKETLFKLGKLYFEHGQNARGLQIYDILKQSNHKKAEHLISFYSAFSNNSKCFSA